MTDLQQETDPHKLITKQDVEHALKADKGFDASLDLFEIKDFTMKGDNYACVVSSVEVHYQKSGKRQEVSYVVKLNPCHPPVPGMGNLMDNFFTKETGFYKKIVPLLDKELQKAGEGRLRVPKHYHSVEIKNRQVIYLENLHKSGFKMYNRQKVMDEAHAELIIKELARLHASSALLQANLAEDLTKKFTFLGEEYEMVRGMDDTMIDVLFGEILESIAVLADKIPGYGYVSDFLRKTKPEIKSFLLNLLSVKEPFNLLSHGDCWNNNFLFRYSATGLPQECRLLDLQLVRVTSPGNDLNHVIYSSTDGQLRRTHLPNLLTSYYATFASVMAGTGVPMRFTLPELRKEFASKHSWGLMLGIMMVPTVLLAPEDVPDRAEFAEFFKRDMQGAMEAYKGAVHKFMLESPSLKPRLLDLFDEMKGYGVFSSTEVSKLVQGFNKRASLKK